MPPAPTRSVTQRVRYAAVGFGSELALVGARLPVMLSTVFALVALAAFARSAA
ncbi:MAG: hypothetical protein R2939_14930 [Kofleriaceae bacterium]